MNLHIADVNRSLGQIERISEHANPLSPAVQTGLDAGDIDPS